MKLFALGSLLTLLCSLPCNAAAQKGPYTFDIPKLYPALYQRWAESLPGSLGPIAEWLAKLNGVSSPIRDVSVAGSPMKFATVCKPHDCGGNIAGILFTPNQGRIIAVVKLTGRNGTPNALIIGHMSNAEFSCIQRLINDHQSVLC